MPCNKPNANVTQPKRNTSGHTLLSAAKSTDRAIPSSTQRLLGYVFDRGRYGKFL
ncbi:hypothetical protein CZ797_08710 [Pseudoalteromonas sp. JB197]|nr:hypothetical protein CZ797_08710 [Pseudoalteromonas sp. JB197]